MEADGAQGYDYVGYHGYAKRRYYELVQRKSFCRFYFHFTLVSFTLSLSRVI
jgi:hypothetical protein